MEAAPHSVGAIYSHTVVDPTDDQTFWTFQMYADSANGWAIQVIQLMAPPPPSLSSSSVSPASVAQGSTQTLRVTGTSSAGSAFFSPLPEYAKHISAVTNAPGVTLSNAAMVLPADPTTTPVTQVTVLATVSATTPPGSYNLTVTNPDGQSVTAPNALVISGPTITLSSLNPASADAASGDFTLTVNGANFTSASVVNFNGAPRPTTFVNSGQLTAAITNADIANIGSYNVTVSANSGAGAATSASAALQRQHSVCVGRDYAGGSDADCALEDQAILVSFRAPGTTDPLFTRTTAVGTSGAFKFAG